MLTQLQRDAMDRAKRGDWSLADAMELLCDANSSHGDDILIGGIRIGGRLRFFAYGEYVFCHACNGRGQARCSECCGRGVINCPDCKGTGARNCNVCDGGKDAAEEPCEGGCNEHHEIECSACDGGGTLDCDECDETGKVECPDCDGEGSFGGEDLIRIVDLNGRTVALAGSETLPHPEAWCDSAGYPPLHVDLTKEEAHRVLFAYHNPPKPDPAPASPGVQTTFFAGEQAA